MAVNMKTRLLTLRAPIGLCEALRERADKECSSVGEIVRQGALLILKQPLACWVKDDAAKNQNQDTKGT